MIRVERFAVLEIHRPQANARSQAGHDGRRSFNSSRVGNPRVSPQE